MRNVFFFIVTLIIISQSKTTYAQPTNKAQQEFDKLATGYRAKDISPEQYMNLSDSLIHQLLSEGIFFETKELVELLSLYEKIAWEHPQYSRDRVNYFYLFFNNARMSRQKGASIYYAEKISKQYKENGEENLLIEQLQKCKIYQELRLYDKVIEVFESEKSYLMQLPELLQQEQIDNSVGLNAMYILSPVIMGYSKMNDTTSVHEIALLAKQIGTTLRHKDGLSRVQMLYTDLLMIDIEHTIANFEHKYDHATQLLDRMERLKTTYSDQATNFIDVNLIRFRIDNYLHLNNQDSIRFYISKYESSPTFSDSQRATLANYKAQLSALQGEYHNAYMWLNEALELEKDIQSNLMAESSELLYAFTQAEHTGIALQKSEQIKKQRTTWLVITAFLAVIIVMSIYLAMLRRGRKAKAQIDILNNTANMQIIAMEEIKHEAVRAEQQRLGQDLHDGLSSSIASVKHQLESLVLDIEERPLKNRLDRIQAEVVNAYEVARNKSHEWFSTAEGEQEKSFEQRIKLVVDSALPNSHYQKNIHIDNGSLMLTSLDMRIALLRITQEAITNIIKHAKARKVDILIYEEMGELMLMIKDDGIGMESKKISNDTPSLGLQSIRRRVRYLNGKINIHSDTTGTEISISIPIVEQL